MGLFDFLKSDLKSKDKQVRKKAIEAESDERKLVGVALSDPLSEFQVLAVRNIASEGLLEKIAKKSTTNEVIRLAIEKLTSQKILSRLAKHTNMQVALSAIKHPDFEDDSQLLKVGKITLDEPVGMAIVDALTNAEYLEKLSKSAALDSVKKRALNKVNSTNTIDDGLVSGNSNAAEAEKPRLGRRVNPKGKIIKEMKPSDEGSSKGAQAGIGNVMGEQDEMPALDDFENDKQKSVEDSMPFLDEDDLGDNLFADVFADEKIDNANQPSFDDLELETNIPAEQAPKEEASALDVESASVETLSGDTASQESGLPTEDSGSLELDSEASTAETLSDDTASQEADFPTEDSRLPELDLDHSAEQTLSSDTPSPASEGDDFPEFPSVDTVSLKSNEESSLDELTTLAVDDDGSDLIEEPIERATSEAESTLNAEAEPTLSAIGESILEEPSVEESGLEATPTAGLQEVTNPLLSLEAELDASLELDAFGTGAESKAGSSEGKIEIDATKAAFSVDDVLSEKEFELNEELEDLTEFEEMEELEEMDDLEELEELDLEKPVSEAVDTLDAPDSDSNLDIDTDLVTDAELEDDAALDVDLELDLDEDLDGTELRVSASPKIEDASEIFHIEVEEHEVDDDLDEDDIDTDDYELDITGLSEGDDSEVETEDLASVEAVNGDEVLGSIEALGLETSGDAEEAFDLAEAEDTAEAQVNTELEPNTDAQDGVETLNSQESEESSTKDAAKVFNKKSTENTLPPVLEELIQVAERDRKDQFKPTVGMPLQDIIDALGEPTKQTTLSEVLRELGREGDMLDPLFQDKEFLLFHSAHGAYKLVFDIKSHTLIGVHAQP